jgi:hypothetical protein
MLLQVPWLAVRCGSTHLVCTDAVEMLQPKSACEPPLLPPRPLPHLLLVGHHTRRTQYYCVAAAVVLLVVVLVGGVLLATYTECWVWSWQDAQGCKARRPAAHLATQACLLLLLPTRCM